MPKTMTRDEQIADLDERDNRLNGHTEIRPSEQCGVVAGGGPFPGKRCTYPEHPHNQPHSWEVQSEPDAELPGHVYDDQPTLPGTPEPESIIPTEASFGKGGKSQPEPALKDICDRLIADDDNLEHLRGVAIRYAWRRRGGLQGGMPRFARIKRPSFWEEHLTGGSVFFLVDLAADHARQYRLTDRQMEAALHEQLVRTSRDEDDHDAFRINGPDFQGSIATLDRYGLWRDDLREAAAHMKPLPLDQALTETADEIDQDDSEEDDE